MSNNSRVFGFAIAAVLSMTSIARADVVNYNGAVVYNPSPVHVITPGLVVNEDRLAGQIMLNTSDGNLFRVWCVDVYDNLTTSGSYTSGTFMSGDVANKINVLLSNVNPLASEYNASSALQLAIWLVEYGSTVSIHASNGQVNDIALSYIGNVSSNVWQADSSMGVALLFQDHNQTLAYLTAVPEPASMAVLAVGLAGFSLMRRKSTTS